MVQPFDSLRYFDSLRNDRDPGACTTCVEQDYENLLDDRAAWRDCAVCGLTSGLPARRPHHFCLGPAVHCIGLMCGAESGFWHSVTLEPGEPWGSDRIVSFETFDDALTVWAAVLIA